METNSLVIYRRFADRKIILLLFLPLLLDAQQVAVSPKHLVNKFIERHITLGTVSQSYGGVRPFTYTNIRKILDDLFEKRTELSVKDHELLTRFRSEFSLNQFSRKIEFPLQKTNLKNLGRHLVSNYHLQDVEPHLLSYSDSTIYAWADFSETFRLENIDKNVHRRYTDKVAVLGSISDNLSFYVNFTMNRFVGDSNLVYQIEEFKNEDHPYFDTMNWTIWYQSEAVFNISTKFGNFGLSKTPLIWGHSPEYSPILSGNTQTYPYFSYSHKYRKIKFHYLHGALLPYESIAIRRLKKTPQKYIAAHRIEAELNENILLSFNELVIYGNRPFELEYLIPINFFWAAEHNQGDRDNLLMAVDFSWRIKRGLKWYNTLFWDELSWEKLFSKWWGNKFIYQTGLHWASKNNQFSPDFRIEATVSRPWTYTHNILVNSYTSAELGLGFPLGPNAQSLLIQVGAWPLYQWYLSFSALFAKKGTGLGSTATDNYDDRNRELDDDTPFLLGDVDDTIQLNMKSNFAINRYFNIFGKIGYELVNSTSSSYIGVNFDW